MIHDALIALLFLAMVLAPCGAAMLTRAELEDDNLTSAPMAGANKVN